MNGLGLLCGMDVNHKQGLVTKKFNNFFYVDTLESNRTKVPTRFLCKSRKNVYFKQNLIFVGDKVVISQINLKDKTAIIENLIERKNLLERPSVANISDIYIIHSVAEPKLNYAQLSQFLINAEFMKVNVSLILTKCDLISFEKNILLSEKFKKWGYKPRILSLISQSPLLDFINELKTKKCSILVGPSGVGKTTLLNKIIPDLNKATSSVSRKIKRGKNTTRNIELFQLSKESYIVDTPGFNIHNNYIEKNFIASLFPEFNNQIKKNDYRCKFRNCLHINEPGCSLNKDFERYKFYKDLVKNSKSHFHQNQED